MQFIQRLIYKFCAPRVMTMVKEPPIIQTVEVIRLRADVLQRIRAEVANPLVSSSTTELEAGFKLGVEHVLQHLNKNYIA